MDDRQLLERIDCLLSSINQRQNGQETGQPNREEAAFLFGQEQGPPILHVYLVDEPGDESEDEGTVESTVEICEKAVPPPTEAATSLTSARPGHRVLAGILLVLAVIRASAALTVWLVPFWTESAQVTLVPAATEITVRTTVTVVPGSFSPQRQEVPGRLLGSLTLTGTRTVPTTGTGYQEARAAHGIITLYNALPSAQTEPAGTLLVGADGIQVATDQDASIPAGSLATNGQVSVPAHALETGPGGNIPAHDIYGACCRADIFAQNASAFTGGQDARWYRMVTQPDINRAVSALKASLAQSVQAAFQAQVHSDETLISPVPCALGTSADHVAGDEAGYVTVTLAETYRGAAYSTQALHTEVMRVVETEAAAQLGTQYRLTGDIQITLMPSASWDPKSGTITLQVKGHGACAYQFTQAQLRRFGTMIAGKSKAQATQALLHQPGVHGVSMSITGRDKVILPTDPRTIRFVVLCGVESYIERGENRAPALIQAMVPT
jgi:hypothetical protein